MAWIQLPGEFKEFLRLLNSNRVEYLVVGGYAIAYHGYARMTADLDVWVLPTKDNSQRLAAALVEFGFSPEVIEPELFAHPSRLIQIGVPPLRVEILTAVTGVEFRDCYSRREVHVIDNVPVSFICLQDLRANKSAMGRPKDQEDLRHLEPPPTSSSSGAV